MLICLRDKKSVIIIILFYFFLTFSPFSPYCLSPTLSFFASLYVILFYERKTSLKRPIKLDEISVQSTKVVSGGNEGKIFRSIVNIFITSRLAGSTPYLSVGVTRPLCSVRLNSSHSLGLDVDI